MTFVDSVRSCFVKYADFSGCASRSEFWWWALFNFVGVTALDLISHKLSGAFLLATLLPYLAVATRRLHDTERTGWFQLVGFIPLIGWIVVILWMAQEGKRPNRFCA